MLAKHVKGEVMFPRDLQLKRDPVKSPTRREDFVDSVVKAFTVDRDLSGLLNVAVYEHGSDDLGATPEAIQETTLSCPENLRKL